MNVLLSEAEANHLATDKEKLYFISLMHNLTNSLTKSRFWTIHIPVISCQIDVLKSMQAENKLPEIAASLNNMLNYCLKFNYYSAELLLLISTNGLVNEISLNSLMSSDDGPFRKDLFLYYAGLCDFEKLALKWIIKLC